MGRWSPTVDPYVPRNLTAIDLGSALEGVASGIGARRGRHERERQEAKSDERYATGQAQASDERNYRRQEDRARDDRQREQDGIAAGDRQRRREGDYLQNIGRARDEGYVDSPTRTARRGAYQGVSTMGGMMDGPMGMGVRGVGDALLAGSDDGQTMTLTRPDDQQETLFHDPTMTREARDEQRTVRIDRERDALRPPPRDPVDEYEGRVKVDQKYHINDFAPKAPKGAGGAGGADSDLKGKITIADKLYDNANAVAARVERQEPKAPDFASFRGMPSPVPGQSDYPAYQADSTTRANDYGAKHGAWESRLNGAHQKAQEWFTVADQLAKQAVGATGGDSVGAQNKTAAALEIEKEQTLFNQKLAGAPDAQTRTELGRAYADRINEINAKYGIRPRSDD